MQGSPSKDRYLKIDTEYWRLKESLITAELMLLRILRFETHIFLPHPYALMILHQLDQDKQKARENSWTLSQYRHLLETTLAVISDSYLSEFLVTLPTRDTETVDEIGKDHAWNLALSSVYLALQSLNISLPDTFENWCQDWGSEETPGRVIALLGEQVKWFGKTLEIETDPRS